MLVKMASVRGPLPPLRLSCHVSLSVDVALERSHLEVYEVRRQVASRRGPCALEAVRTKRVAAADLPAPPADAPCADY